MSHNASAEALRLSLQTVVRQSECFHNRIGGDGVGGIKDGDREEDGFGVGVGDGDGFGARDGIWVRIDIREGEGKGRSMG